LPEVFGETRKSNGSMCTMTMRAFLYGQNVELVGHPQYSPGLGPNDFFLFPYMKRKMRGQGFS